MEATGLGFRTDLAILALAGSEVEDRGNHLVIRSPQNPLHWWGNFLLLQRAPAAAEVPGWLDVFAGEFPQAKHIAFGVDAQGTVADLAPFVAHGLSAEAATVMSASAVRPPPRPNTDAEFRRLATDDDWAQCIELSVLCNDRDIDEASNRGYITAWARATRRLIADGAGSWFGAFLDGRLVAQMGLLRTEPALARYQRVETHPEFRGRGLAGTLVWTVGRFGFDELGVEKLVMVADPDYLAVRIYRSVGFVDGEVMLQAERPPVAPA